jgi:hypothetical protein
MQVRPRTGGRADGTVEDARGGNPIAANSADRQHALDTFPAASEVQAFAARGTPGDRR